MSAQAALELRGVDNQGNRLIYDTDFDITWYDYTNSAANWWTQMSWASGLSVSGGNLAGVYDDWRLPTALNQDGTGPCGGYNCTGSEMGYLFYTELGNKGLYDTSGNRQPDYGLTNTGDFQKLKSYYWSGTEYSADPYYYAWFFGTNAGGQVNDHNVYNFYAVAVHPGDVAVAPEPMSMVLFGVGATVLGARRMVLRRRG